MAASFEESSADPRKALAAVLVSLGAFDNEPWPPYTSHIALELFKKQSGSPAEKGWFESLWGKSGKMPHSERKQTADLTESEKRGLDNHYVRLRYNDKVMKVPGCKAEGKHLEGDESFCTLQAFKEIVDKFTPPSWKQGCNRNLTEPALRKVIEPAGH